MVIKQILPAVSSMYLFESRVVLDGNQTCPVCRVLHVAFESRVVLDGNQTKRLDIKTAGGFESRVVLDGNQTKYGIYIYIRRYV